MSDSPDPQVAIVGAGVAGLAMAVGLSQVGLSVALVGPPARRVPAGPAFDARIYALSQGSVRLLEQLRVWPQVDASRLQPVQKMRVFGDTGAELRFDAWSVAAERIATIAEEGELLRVLSLAAEFAPGVRRVPVAMAGLRFNAEGGATLQLADGSTLSVPLVIGADGAESAVRAAAGIDAEVVAYDQTAVVANYACSVPHDGVAWQWFTDDGVVALLPLPGQACSLVWSAPEALGEHLKTLAPDALAVRLMTRLAASAPALPIGRATLSPLGAPAEPSRPHAFRLRRLRVDRLSGDSVALIGDAAHVVHPLAGHGLNLGLQDVSMLLDILRAREPWRRLGDPVLLQRYARRRAEPIDLMRWTTDGLARLFGHDDPLLRQARNAGMSLVNAAGPLKRALVRHAMG
jgi:ubiquinone biosynthesis UbiH/UbiF/VisC/COQ6 family hydroxylase